MHPDELAIDDALVRRLVDRDLPDCAGLPLRRMPVTGSSNVLYRLGSQLVVRLPRQPGGSNSIESESLWLRYLAPGLPVAVPELVASGRPGFGYPERWSVTRWIEGDPPGTPHLGSESDLASDLAAFVLALRGTAVPAAALTDPALRRYRAGPLSAIDAAIRSCLDECRALPGLDLDLGACAEVWAAAVELPEAEVLRPQWVHGDLLAENLLLRAGRLHAVLDFGGLAVGDPSVDLVVSWEVLDDRTRPAFRSAVGIDDTSWLRGRGWALAIALMTLPYYWRSMPARCAARLVMANHVLADHSRHT